MYLSSFWLISIVYIPFTSRHEKGLSPEPKRCNKMCKQPDSPLLPYKMAIQNHNEAHTDRSQNQIP